ncbi:MAG TPA: protein kinase [Steroidobacteraceae bacterium]|nr:protein kinase [Steroidobacteraceae bacterium]
MSARSLETGHRRTVRNRAWSLRTVDLESTADFDADSATTSDLKSLITHDFVVDPILQTSRSITRHTPSQPPTVDLAPIPNSAAGATEIADREPGAACRPGNVLADRYLLEQVIGTGGTAIVLRARDMHSSANAAPNAQVAIKMPRPDFVDRERAIARLQHEFKCTHRLDHPNVVKVFDIQHDDDNWFMTMELIEGKPLSALLRDGSTLTKAVTQQVLTSCADALAHAHERGVVHGDFKPANVFIARSNAVKVIDFGAAFSPTASDARIPAGTPAYASPEVLSGLDPEPRDDVFSFACVAYEMLTGRHPYERRSSLEAREAGSVPPRAWNLSANQWLSLLQALSLDREQRPSDVRALAEMLHKEPQIAPEESLVKPEASLVPASPPLPDDILPPQRSWGFFLFVAVAVVLLFIAAQRSGKGDQHENPVAPTSHESTQVSAPPLSPNIANPTPGSAAQPAAEAKKKSAVIENDLERRAGANAMSPASQTEAAGAADPSATAPVSADTKKAARTGYASEVGFASNNIVTSESSIAAVFLLKRSGSLRDRASVRWSATSGSAENDEDFIAGNGGTVEFAPGQSQRVIYVPLRNDTKVEGDETFTVRIASAQRAKLGEIQKVEATIRDDD